MFQLFYSNLPVLHTHVCGLVTNADPLSYMILCFMQSLYIW